MLIFPSLLVLLERRLVLSIDGLTLIPLRLEGRALGADLLVIVPLLESL